MSQSSRRGGQHDVQFRLEERVQKSGLYTKHCNQKIYKSNYFQSTMIKGKWTGILLVACGIVLFIGGTFKSIEGFSSSAWTLLHGILLIVFAVGLVILGIRELRKSNQ